MSEPRTTLGKGVEWGGGLFHAIAGHHYLPVFCPGLNATQRQFYRSRHKKMIGIYNPLPLLYLAGGFLVLFVTPFVIRSWRRFAVYVSCVSLVFTVFWFDPDLKYESIFESCRIAHVFGVTIGLLKHFMTVAPEKLVSRLSAAAIMLFVFIGIPAIYQQSQIYWFNAVFPKGIEISDTIFVAQGIRKNCGIAVFQISQKTQQAVSKSGLTFFTELGKVSDSKFGKWSQTPYQITESGVGKNDHWLNGLFCAHIDDEQRDMIVKALDSKDSFYSKEENSGIFVVPSLRLAVYSYTD